MLKQIIILLVAFVFAGCSRSPAGAYQSFGSEDKFRITLDLVDGGQARFTTRSNLGNPELDRGVEATMSLDNARWSHEGEVVVVNGSAKDGKAATYRFLRQKNGDLIWEKTGARLVRAK